MPGPDRARRAWERHEKIGPPAAAKVAANFLPSSPAHAPAHSPALRSPCGRPYERCDVHPSTRELRGCPASSAGTHQASSSARGGVARVVRLVFTRARRRVFQPPRGGGRTIYEGAPSFGRRRRYGSSLLRGFLLECIAPSLPLRRHHFYQLIAHWHANGQQEFCIRIPAEPSPPESLFGRAQSHQV